MQYRESLRILSSFKMSYIEFLKNEVDKVMLRIFYEIIDTFLYKTYQ